MNILLMFALLCAGGDPSFSEEKLKTIRFFFFFLKGCSVCPFQIPLPYISRKHPRCETDHVLIVIVLLDEETPCVEAAAVKMERRDDVAKVWFWR